MKITIHRFRCHDHAEFDFTDGNIILLKGHTGCGKTTVLEAIRWCLFGSTRKITPHRDPDNKKNPTWVRIDLADWGVIQRQNIPRLLQVYVNSYSRKFDNLEAQKIIDDLFGGIAVWQSVSYVKQGERSTFLNSSNSAKLELLTSLAYHDEDPGFYIDKINQELISVKTSLGVRSDQYTLSSDNLLRIIYDNGITEGEKTMEVPDEQSLEIKRQTLQSELNRLNEVNTQNQIVIATRERYIREKNDLSEKLRVLHVDGEASQSIKEKLVKFGEEIARLKILQEKREKIRQYIEERETLLTQLPDTPSSITSGGIEEYSSEQLERELIEKSVLLSNYNANLELARKHGVDYTADAVSKAKIEANANVTQQRESSRIEQAKVRYRQIFDHVKEFENKLNEYRRSLAQVDGQLTIQVEDLKRRMNALDPNPIETAKKSIQDFMTTQPVNDFEDTRHEHTAEITRLTALSNELSSDLSSKRQMKQIYDMALSCPKCNANLRYNDGQLQLIDISSDLTEKLQSEISGLELSIADIIAKLDGQKAKLATVETQILTYERSSQQWNMECERHKEKTRLYIENIERERSEISRLSESSQRDTQIRKKDLNDIIGSYQARLTEYQEELSRLKLEHPNIDQPSELLISGVNWVTRLQDLEKVIVLNPPDIDPNTFKREITRRRITVRLNELDNLIGFEDDTVVDDLNRLLAEESTLHVIYQKRLEEEAMISSIRNRESGIDEELFKLGQMMVEDVSQDLINANEAISQHAKLTQRYSLLRQVQVERNRIISEHGELQKLHKKTVQLSRLYGIAVEAEYLMLENVANQINSILSEMTSRVFDDPITVKLSMFKPLKTTGRIKPQVNLEILYKGGMLEQNQLSGGEQERLSMIMTLALNRFIGGPLILLDETLASLDGEKREDCLTTLKKFKGGRTVICINHESCDGHYDDVIPLDV